MSELMSPAELEAALRRIGDERYHNHHPLHKLLHGGKLTRGQVQAWPLNRDYYQRSIPMNDAWLMGRCDDAAMPREWISRIIDYDGTDGQPGGIERWLELAEGVGLVRDYVVSCRGILPATKFAVEAYIRFVREKPLLEAVASSLTELFSPTIISERVSGMLRNYDFVTE